MLKKIKTFVIEKFAMNFKFCFATLILYIAVVGPNLVSARDTVSVAAGIGVGLGWVLWFNKILKARFTTAPRTQGEQQK